MNDWRQSLEWIVLVVFIFLLVFSFLIGVMSGLKRTLYWTIVNIIFWALAMIFTLTLSKTMANTFSAIIGKKNVDLQKSAYDIIYTFAGLIFFLICTIAGNLVIAIPLYFGLFKKILKIGPKNNKGAKLTVKSRFAAAPISLVLFFPQTLLLTSATIAGTTHFTSAKKNGIQQAAYNIYKITNVLNSYINFYVGDLYNNVNCVFNLLNLVKGDTLKEMSNNISTFADNLQTEFENLDFSAGFTQESADKVDTVLNSFQSVTEPAKLGDQLDEIFATKLGVQLLKDNLDKFSFDVGITKKDFDDMALFIQSFHDGYDVNTFVMDKNSPFFDVAEIKMKEETEQKKIPISYNTFTKLTDLLKYKIFKKDEWTDAATCLYATQLLLGTFIFNVNKEPLFNSSPNDFKDIKLTPIIDIDTIIKDNLGDYINQDNVTKFANANGSKDYPYIIPINLFYLFKLDDNLYHIDDLLPTKKLPITFGLKNTKGDYPAYQNLKYQVTSEALGTTKYMENYMTWSSNTELSMNINLFKKDIESNTWKKEESDYFHTGNFEEYKISFTSSNFPNFGTKNFYIEFMDAWVSKNS